MVVVFLKQTGNYPIQMVLSQTYTMSYFENLPFTRAAFLQPALYLETPAVLSLKESLFFFFIVSITFWLFNVLYPFGDSYIRPKKHFEVASTTWLSSPTHLLWSSCLQK